jgi:MarR family transcriptional regulator, temperature-dependent positive regulator of motility
LIGRELDNPCNFRNDSQLACAQVLTPQDLREKLHLTRTFLTRKQVEFSQLARTIAAIRHEHLEPAD